MHFSLKHVLKKKKRGKFHYKNCNYIIKKKKIKIHGFNFIWSLFLEVLLAWIAALVGVTFSFSLGAYLAGMVIEAKASSKPWEVASTCRTSVVLSEGLFTSEEISLGALDSFACPCWLGGGGSWGCVPSIGTATVEATSPWVEEGFEARIIGG